MPVRIVKISNVWIRIDADPGILKELAERLTFEVPGARWSPAFKSGRWDGKIRLFNARYSRTYTGLLGKVLDFCQTFEYGVEVDPTLTETTEFSIKEATDFAGALNLPFEARDYQVRAFALAVRNRRLVLVSPTASGKSLIAFLLTMWFEGRVLIVVPTTSLVHQLVDDFKNYGYAEHVHGVTGGVEKTTTARVTVSTWQSVYEQDESFFAGFGMLIGDEAHLFKAKSLTTIMENVDAEYRIGMTGTLDGSTVNELVLEGLFGPVHRVTTSSELMTAGHIADLKIKVLVLKHPPETCRALTRAQAKDKNVAAEKKKASAYATEIAELISNPGRNEFLKNLVLSLKGNTLILFTLVEKHGKILHQMIELAAAPGRVHFIHGGVETEDREATRKITEKSTDAVLVASYGTFSTGIDIRNLNNVVLASPTKSRIRLLQSIGRGLRTSDTKTTCTVFDVGDDLTYGSRKNHTLNHLRERVNIYNGENFKYELHTIKLRPRH